jgi:NarL family two-component system response regulator LiaR
MAATRAHDLDAAERVRVVIADPDPSRRRAVRDALAGDRRLVVAADAADLRGALELTRWYRPQIVLVELGLAPASAPLRELATLAPGAVVVLAPDDVDLDAALRALRAGARGFVSLGADRRQLGAALRAVAAGEVAISPRLTMAVLEEVRPLLRPQGMRPVRSALTAREWEVLDLLASGATTGEIATALEISRHTVYGHVKQILRRLGAGSRAEAVRAASVLRPPMGL